MADSAAGVLAKLLLQCANLGVSKAAVAALRALRDEALLIKASGTSRGPRARRPRSAKVKGRAGVVEAKACILAAFPTLEDDDIVIQTTSVGGSDLQLSPAAQRLFPFAPESKNTETLNVWAALAQAKVNADKKRLRPILFFRRNRSDMYIALDAATFFRYFSCKDEVTHGQSAAAGTVVRSREPEAG